MYTFNVLYSSMSHYYNFVQCRCYDLHKKNIVNHCVSVIAQHLCLLIPEKVNKIHMKVFFSD